MKWLLFCSFLRAMSYSLFDPLIFLLSLCLFTGACGETLLTIAQAESIAVNNAFQIQIDQKTTASNKWQYWNALGTYLPSVQASSQYLRLSEDYFTSPTGIFPGGSSPGGPLPGLSKAAQQPSPFDTGAIPRNLFINEISVNQAIFNSSAFVGIKISSAAQDAQLYQSEATRQQVIFNVNEAYYNTVAAEGRLRSVELALQFAMESLQNTRIRQQSGVVAITDSLRWEAQVAENRAALAQAEAAVKQSKLALLSAMGYKLDTISSQINVEPFENFAAQCSTLSATSGTNLQIDQNPSYQAVKKSTDIARLQTTLALSRYLPVLSAFYSYQWQAYNQFFPDNGGTWYLGLSLSIPLFSSFTNTSSYLQQRSLAQRSIIEQEQARNGFISQARLSHLTYTSSLIQVQAASQRRNLMEKTLSIMDVRYRSGVANQTDLLQVALETEQARVAYIEAVSQCLIARARYKLSIGTLEVSHE